LTGQGITDLDRNRELTCGTVAATAVAHRKTRGHLGHGEFQLSRALIFGTDRRRNGLFRNIRIARSKPMSKLPPVPPEQRSQKGPGSDPDRTREDKIPGRENFDSQGRQGNIKQNTTNQGYQQDR